MKERPILFSAPMVRAILDGRKTQTRRPLRIQPLDILPIQEDKAGIEWVGLMQREPEPRGTVFRCKFGQPGDRLWVRETWAYHPDFPESTRRAIHRAERGVEHDVDRWRPSIHMPRWASRLLLEVTAVRVERLQDISHADAMAEGMAWDDAVYDYSRLWEQINGTGSWDANPWIWVVEFKRVQS